MSLVSVATRFAQPSRGLPLFLLFLCVSSTPVSVFDAAPVWAHYHSYDASFKGRVISEVPEYLSSHSRVSAGASINGAFLSAVSSDHGHGVESIIWSVSSDGSTRALARDLGECNSDIPASRFGSSLALFVCRLTINGTEVVFSSDATARGTRPFFTPDNSADHKITSVVTCGDSAMVAARHGAQMSVWSLRLDGSISAFVSLPLPSPSSWLRFLTCPGPASDGVAAIVGTTDDDSGAGSAGTPLLVSFVPGGIGILTVLTFNQPVGHVARIGSDYVLAGDLAGRSAVRWSTRTGASSAVWEAREAGEAMIAGVARISATEAVLLVHRGDGAPDTVLRVTFSDDDGDGMAGAAVATASILTDMHARGLSLSMRVAPPTSAAALGAVVFVAESDVRAELWVTKGGDSDATALHTLPPLHSVSSLTCVDGAVFVDALQPEADGGARVIAVTLGSLETARVVYDLGVVGKDVAASGQFSVFSNDVFFAGEVVPPTLPTCEPIKEVCPSCEELPGEGLMIIAQAAFAALVVMAVVMPIVLSLIGILVGYRYERNRMHGVTPKEQEMALINAAALEEAEQD